MHLRSESALDKQISEMSKGPKKCAHRIQTFFCKGYSYTIRYKRDTYYSVIFCLLFYFNKQTHTNPNPPTSIVIKKNDLSL